VLPDVDVHVSVIALKASNPLAEPRNTSLWVPETRFGSLTWRFARATGAP